MQLIKCLNFNEPLTYDFENKEYQCNFCGTICNFENEKIDSTLKPQKILLFEIELNEVKEKVKEYFINSAFEYKDYIINELKPIYLPYWMYKYTCEIEYTYYNILLDNDYLFPRKLYLTKAKIECEGILANASSKIENNLTKKIDKYFDLFKMKDYDSRYVEKIYQAKYDTTFKMAYKNIWHLNVFYIAKLFNKT